MHDILGQNESQDTMKDLVNTVRVAIGALDSDGRYNTGHVKILMEQLGNYYMAHRLWNFLDSEVAQLRRR